MPLLQEDKAKTERTRYWVPGLSQDPDKRSIQVGLILTVLVHLLLLLIAPQILHEEFSPGRFVQPGTTAQTFDIQMVPPPPVKPPPQHFVETNPEANSTVPDKTNNFGAQNQTAAQPHPDKKSKLRMPKTVGKKNFKNDSQVVTGTLQKQPPRAAPAPPPVVAQKGRKGKAAQPAKEKVPLSGFTQSIGKNPDAFGTGSVKLPKVSNGADKYVEGRAKATNATGSGANTAEAQAVPQRPLPRPRLTPVRPGILEARPIGVNNAGTIAVDAHFSQFGDYLQELIDTVQIQWERILNTGGISPPSGSHVTIRFRINSQGQIAEILKVDGDAGDYGSNAALSAIRDPAPYRPWTKEMVAVLGNDQVITFSFYYW